MTFNASPDHEVPLDGGTNNVYDIIVNVNDGVNAVATKAVAITVTDLNDTAPAITSGATGSEAENTAADERRVSDDDHRSRHGRDG